MNFKQSFFIIIFYLITHFGFANIYENRVLDTIQNISPKINIDLYLNLKDLNDVEIKNNFFNAELWYELQSKKNFDSELIMYNLDANDLSDLISLKYYTIPRSNPGTPDDRSDSLYFKSTHSLSVQFDHNWKIRTYPFDNPQLTIQFVSKHDSSFVSLNPRDTKFASFEKEMENLKDGFKIKSIEIKKDFVSSENDPIDESKDARNIVKEKITFLVNLDREGSWLYLKLFLGSFLAFLISWLVFFIPTKDFSSRIELSVGAIFGAVGNRAYVESIMPDIQVFTKADMINNTVILLIIFNIIIFMIQRNKLIQLDFFESNWNSAIYTAFIFIVINTAILIW